MSKKLSDIDISVLVNNVGVSIPVDRDASATFREIAANCYPVVLLTQEMISRFQERWTKKAARSIFINFSSQAAIMPTPHFSNYSATKVFDDYFSKGLYYELRANGIDVLSVQPAAVATLMTGRKPNFLKMVITPEACAKGTLDNATSFITYGGTVHEFAGLITKCLCIDLLPHNLSLYLTSVVAVQIKEEK